MKHITIIIPDGQSNLSTIACIVGAHEIFTAANNYWRKNNKRELFKIQWAGVSETTEFNNGMLTLQAHTRVAAIPKTNLIILPSVVNTYQKAMDGNQVLIDWIKQQYKNGAEVATMCSGAFMLASSGLLDGKICSTHWAYADAFRKLFPNVTLHDHQLITHENGIYTNGGAYSFLNLIIYLVEKYYDRPTAIYCSKIFQIEMDRDSQSPFTMFTGQKLHGDEMVKKAQDYIESKLHEKISVEDLSSRFSIGRRNFDRRFIKATGNTPLEYAQRVKIESAKKAFETTRKTVNEVMYENGYSDVKAFREVFRKITGMSPLDYRNKYNRETVMR